MANDRQTNGAHKRFFAQLNTPNAFYRAGETTNNMKDHSQSMS